MKEIKDKIVFSYDIGRILDGINSYDYNYGIKIKKEFLNNLREWFLNDVNKIFNNKVFIINEEEMLEVNRLIGGEYPHCYIG